MTYDLLSMYFTGNFSDLTVKIRGAEPETLLYFVLAVTAVLCLTTWVLLSLLGTAFRPLLKSSAGQNGIKLAIILSGGLGIILFVLESGGSARDGLAERTAARFNVALSSLEDQRIEARPACSGLGLDHVGATAADAASARLICAWDSEHTRLLDRAAKTMNPADWAEDNLAVYKNDPKAFPTAYAKAFDAAFGFVAEYSEHAAKLDLPSDGPLRSYFSQVSDLLSTIKSEMSSRAAEVAEDVGTTQRFEQIREYTIIFMTIMAMGMALEFALLLGEGTSAWLRRLLGLDRASEEAPN